MLRLTVVAIALLCLANAERTFLGESTPDVASVVDNGGSKLTKTGVQNIDSSSECLENLARVDDLIELLSEFFVSSSKDLSRVVFLDGGFQSIIDSCVTEFSSPDLMDCSNDIEGIEDHLDQIISILTADPEASFSGLNPDSLSRAKSVCIIPVADEICELELEANLEDTAALLADVYGLEEVSGEVILEDAYEAARELKTLYYACDLTENEVFAEIELAILRVLLVIESCDTTQTTCDAIDGEELQELVNVLEANGIIGDRGEGEGESGEGQDGNGDGQGVQDIAETGPAPIPALEVSEETQVSPQVSIPVLVEQE